MTLVGMPSDMPWHVVSSGTPLDKFGFKLLSVSSSTMLTFMDAGNAALVGSEGAKAASTVGVAG